MKMSVACVRVRVFVLWDFLQQKALSSKVEEKTCVFNKN